MVDLGTLGGDGSSALGIDNKEPGRGLGGVLRWRARRTLGRVNHSADISGDRIVRVDDRGGALKVFRFDLSSGQELQVSPYFGVADGRPRIDGRRIVWTDRRDGYEDVYLFVPKDP